jgi:hypothetical protein
VEGDLMAGALGFDLRVLAKPPEAIPQITQHEYVIVDRFAALVFPWTNTAGAAYQNSFQNLNPTVNLDWAAQPAFTALNNVQFVRFSADGRVYFTNNPTSTGLATGAEMPAGWMIKPRFGLLDSRIGINSTAFNGTGGAIINWQALEGSYKTVLPPNSPGNTAIFNFAFPGEGSEEEDEGLTYTCRARTQGDIPANRSLFFKLAFDGHDEGGPQPEQYIFIGDKWALVARHDAHWMIERKNSNGAWEIIRVLYDAPKCDLSRGEYAIEWMRIAGFGVVSINGATFWFLDTIEPLSNFAGQGLTAAPKAKEVTWPAMPLLVASFNCHVSLRLCTIKWSEAGGTRFTATIVRRQSRRTPLAVDAQPDVTAATGWVREGTGAVVSPVIEPGAATYTLTLTANADGIDSPFVDKVFVRWPRVWSAPSQSAVDLRPGLVGAQRVQLAMPPVSSCSTATLNLDRLLLDRFAPGWRTALQDYSPIEIQARTFDNYAARGNWTTVFKGYAIRPNKKTEGVNDWQMTLVCMDEAVRFIKPAAMVKAQNAPLDIEFVKRGQTVLASNGIPGGGTRFYGAEAVQCIARTFHSDALADNINGNGNPLRYFPEDHPPLLSNDSDRAGYLPVAGALGESTTLPPITQGKLFFPAPHGSDAMTWFGQFEGADNAVTFFERGVLIYGQLLEILATRTIRRIADGNYQAGDLARLARQMEAEKRPESDVNVVDVWSLSDDGLAGLFPALRMAQARLEADDPNRAERTWERSDIVRTAFALTGAERIADLIVANLRNVIRHAPRATLRGDEAALPGDVFYFALGVASDPTIGLNADALNGGALYARSEAIEHEWSFGDYLEYWMTPACRPLSQSERARLGI